MHINLAPLKFRLFLGLKKTIRIHVRMSPHTIRAANGRKPPSEDVLHFAADGVICSHAVLNHLYSASICGYWM